VIENIYNREKALEKGVPMFDGKQVESSSGGVLCVGVGGGRVSC